MPEPSEGAELEPVVRPRLIRLLKNRPRLIEDSFREEILEEMDREICRRRAPDRIAEDAVRECFNRAADSAARPVRNRVRRRLERANEGILEEL